MVWSLYCCKVIRKVGENVIKIVRFFMNKKKRIIDVKHIYLQYLTSNSEVPNLSKVNDLILEICTPISLWIPEHSIHTKMPRLVENQVGSVEQTKTFL